MGLKSTVRLIRTLGLLLHLWPNLLGVFYPMPLGGRIASSSLHRSFARKLPSHGNSGSVKTLILVAGSS